MNAFLMLSALITNAVEPTDFDTQVMPVLTKAGCNAGACHGAAAGRGGFHLSLYGSRPGDDFEAITLELESRRIDRQQPDNSLLLKKATETINHGGGTRLDIDGPGYNILFQWLADGARRRRLRSLKDFEFTADRTLVPVGGHFSVSAKARFSDGAVDNVLQWTAVTITDPSALIIEDDNRFRAVRPGRHLMLARFLDRVVPLQITVPRESSTPKNVVAATSPIDEFVEQRLLELGLSKAPSVDDAAFIRRLSLDLTGQLPTTDDVIAYTEDSSRNKRIALVDKLIASEAFTEFWTHRLAQLLRVNTMKPGSVSAGYYSWIKECVADNTPLTHVATKLITSQGAVAKVPAANFYSVTGDARAQAEYFSQLFMGVRLQCANCHDHPLDSWTQDDYHGLAAIFAGVKRGAEIRFTKSGEVIHPATGEAAIPKLPGNKYVENDAAPRRVLAEWLTSPDNPYFAKAAVNRIWSYLMGRGLVEPVDDLRVTNPATHPELLNWLVNEFVRDNYRPTAIIKTICLSDAYARSSKPIAEQRGFAAYYDVGPLKSMSAEVLLDAIGTVTGMPSAFSLDASKSDYAVSLKGLVSNSPTLDLLGGCGRDAPCDSSSVSADNLALQLHLLNGSLLNQRISDAGGLLHQRLSRNITAASLIEEFYLRALSRAPSDRESAFWVDHLKRNNGESIDPETAEDFLWSLLTSREFITNR